MGISTEIIQAILADYALPRFGFHGVSHWARVLENGTRLAERTGADLKVVQLFAVFHDSRRVNEGWDDGHGWRGAEFARQQRGKLFDLPDAPFEQLHFACAFHTDGETDADVTIQTCWDSDRLDLGRVGIVPEPEKLCTDAAKSREILRWAESRSREQQVPEFVSMDWGVDVREDEGDDEFGWA